MNKVLHQKNEYIHRSGVKISPLSILNHEHPMFHPLTASHCYFLPAAVCIASPTMDAAPPYSWPLEVVSTQEERFKGPAISVSSTGSAGMNIIHPTQPAGREGSWHWAGQCSGQTGAAVPPPSVRVCPAAVFAGIGGGGVPRHLHRFRPGQASRGTAPLRTGGGRRQWSARTTPNPITYPRDINNSNDHFLG